MSSFFWLHSISENNEQNLLNLELVVFDLKNKASTKQLPVTDFFVKKKWFV